MFSGTLAVHRMAMPRATPMVLQGLQDGGKGGKRERGVGGGGRQLWPSAERPAGTGSPSADEPSPWTWLRPKLAQYFCSEITRVSHLLGNELSLSRQEKLQRKASCRGAANLTSPRSERADRTPWLGRRMELLGAGHALLQVTPLSPLGAAHTHRAT